MVDSIAGKEISLPKKTSRAFLQRAHKNYDKRSCKTISYLCKLHRRIPGKHSNLRLPVGSKF
jgi:hypothetical protein